METDTADFQAINIGTGCPVSVKEIAQLLSKGLGKNIEPEVVGKYREGDIRHCVGDVTKARELLGYEPKINLEEGLLNLLDWVKEQRADDRVATATAELVAHQLVR